MGVTHQTGPAALRLRVALEQLGKVRGQVGWFESAKYADGTPVAYVAAIQEFGDPEHDIPPRSFVRTTQAARAPVWRELAQTWARRVIRGEVSAAAMMGRIGMQAAGDISKTISQINSPPLKPETVKARLRKLKGGGVRRGAISITAAKPLVDSGIMLATLSHNVEGV